MKKLIVTVALSLSGMLCAFAQTPSQNFSQHPRAYTHRNSFWSEINAFGNITADKKWQYQIDYQYRRMADASYIQGGNHGNIFKDPYQQVVRPWIHYWIKPGAIRFSLSPIGYWITWTPSQEGQVYKTEDGNVGRTVFPEFRVCPQVTFQQTYGRFQFVNRYRYEFRWVGNREKSSGFFNDLDEGFSFYPNAIGQGHGSNHLGRFRWQIRGQVLLNKAKMEKNTIYLNMWNELFIGVGKHIDFMKMLNQNRTVALIGWRLPTGIPIRVEAGVTYQAAYLYNIGTPPTQPNVTYQKQNVELNTAYTIYVIIDDFHTIFKKKKPETEH